jgi:hypothetical protein
MIYEVLFVNFTTGVEVQGGTFEGKIVAHFSVFNCVSFLPPRVSPLPNIFFCFELISNFYYTIQFFYAKEDVCKKTDHNIFKIGRVTHVGQFQSPRTSLLGEKGPDQKLHWVYAVFGGYVLFCIYVKRKFE